MGERCPHCGQAMPLAVADQQIIDALKHPGEMRGKGGKIIRPWLYAAADQFDSRKANFDSWHVTGPPTRKGYVAVTLRYDQVKRIAATGKLRPVCSEDGRPIAYELA